MFLWAYRKDPIEKKHEVEMNQYLEIRNSLFLAALFSCGFILLGHSKAAAYEYEISGMVVSEYAAEIAVVKGPSVYNFKVSVQGSRWHILLTPKDIPSHEPIKIGNHAFGQVIPDYREASSDGTSFYEVISMVSSRLKNPKIQNSGQALRGDGSIPYGIEDEIMCLWYLYASHEYLKGTKDAKIHPLQCLSESSYAKADFREPAEWVLSEQPPGLPIVILTKGIIDGMPITNASLKVTNFHSVSGMEFPATARLEFFFLLPKVVEQKIVRQVSLRRWIEVTATTFMTKSQVESFVPPLPAPCVVQDTRHWTNVPAKTVSLQVSNWPSQKQVSAAYARSVRYETGKAVTKGFGTKRAVVLIGLVALALVPLVFFAVQRTYKSDS